MYLTRLALTDFRSYAALEMSLGAGVSTFVGANGEGKTNLVEAIGYLATLGSHRVAADAPLVRSGAERAILRAMVTGASRDSLLELEINPGRANRARLNRVPLPTARKLLGALRTALFAPEDIVLVKGEPDQRRRFLDDLLVASAPRYAGIRADYERVLRQRTALLKSLRGRGASAAGTLDIWDEQLVSTGTALLAARIKLTGALQPLVAKAYEAVSGEPGVAEISYRMSFWSKGLDGPPETSADPGLLAAALREALTRVRAAELERGVCLAGPHRDDLELRITSLPARGYASHGESWSMALALRLAGFDLLRAAGDDPVLLLDDVFAELDTGRRQRLAGLVSGAEQVIVTAAVPDDVPVALAGVRFEVHDGTVTRAG